MRAAPARARSATPRLGTRSGSAGRGQSLAAPGSVQSLAPAAGSPSRWRGSGPRAAPAFSAPLLVDTGFGSAPPPNSGKETYPHISRPYNAHMGGGTCECPLCVCLARARKQGLCCPPGAPWVPESSASGCVQDQPAQSDYHGKLRVPGLGRRLRTPRSREEGWSAGTRKAGVSGGPRAGQRAARRLQSPAWAGRPWHPVKHARPVASCCVLT